MKNKILFFVSVLLFAAIVLSSCGKDDENPNQVSEEWKDYQAKLYRDALEKDLPYNLKFHSYSGNGTVCAKKSSDITDEKTTKVGQDGKPSFNNSVVVRYTGWYYQLDGTKKIFDSTEGAYNRQQGVGFRVNQVVDGWTTILQQMRFKDGESMDEVEICIPHVLGYGPNGNYTQSGGLSIPGYTTLFFVIKLVKIIPVNPDEFPDVRLE